MLVGVVEVAEGLAAEGGRAAAVVVGEEVVAGGAGMVCMVAPARVRRNLVEGMGVGRTCGGPRSPIPRVKSEGPTGAGLWMFLGSYLIVASWRG